MSKYEPFKHDANGCWYFDIYTNEFTYVPNKKPPQVEIKKKSIYVIGSLRNPEIPRVATVLRELGFDAFDDWYAAGPEADDYWKKYENSRGHDIVDALEGYAGKHVLEFDKTHLKRCSSAILVLPAGRSGHLELGYATGLGKDTYILLAGEPDRMDVMYGFAKKVFRNIDEMEKYFGEN